MEFSARYLGWGPWSYFPRAWCLLRPQRHFRLTLQSQVVPRVCGIHGADIAGPLALRVPCGLWDLRVPGSLQPDPKLCQGVPHQAARSPPNAGCRLPKDHLCGTLLAPCGLDPCHPLSQKQKGSGATQAVSRPQPSRFSLPGGHRPERWLTAPRGSPNTIAVSVSWCDEHHRRGHQTAGIEFSLSGVLKAPPLSLEHPRSHWHDGWVPVTVREVLRSLPPVTQRDSAPAAHSSDQLADPPLWTFFPSPHFHALPPRLPRVTAQANCLYLNPRLGGGLLRGDPHEDPEGV